MSEVMDPYARNELLSTSIADMNDEMADIDAPLASLAFNMNSSRNDAASPLSGPEIHERGNYNHNHHALERTGRAGEHVLDMRLANTRMLNWIEPYNELVELLRKSCRGSEIPIHDARTEKRTLEEAKLNAFFESMFQKGKEIGDEERDAMGVTQWFLL
ncbi:hypothetical protein EX30DRAFT_373188 [Ascodesmis nigricans]|uniref:Uncharacterized protein n=1 Tax=Ascodesmis nigricans TaxID=341454 RepID=A0A4S2MSR6_9PEZI|nr:hypothetical protein EX30DRAFT_373188 [Ascodesmis nigricans]